MLVLAWYNFVMAFLDVEKRGRELRRLVGLQIRKARERKGWSQPQLAKALKRISEGSWSQSAVAKVENGTRDVLRLEQIELFSIALGEPPFFLLLPLLTSKDTAEIARLAHKLLGAEGQARFIRERNELDARLNDSLRQLSLEERKTMTDAIAALANARRKIARTIPAVVPDMRPVHIVTTKPTSGSQERPATRRKKS
jgi:transcriptional regulator with XRE-family HTH domain